VGELFAAGNSIADIQALFGVKRDTVVAHLDDYFRAGGKIDPQRLLQESTTPEPGRERVFSAFTELGTDRLSPVHSALEGAVPYDELRLLRISFLARAMGS
jgi:hypothetical protein